MIGHTSPVYCEPSGAPRVAPVKELPVHFVAGPACGMYAMVLNVDHIDMPSPSVHTRTHLYRFSGRSLPTDPPVRIFVHAGIVDRS